MTETTIDGGFRKRRSYHTVGYRELMRLPVGVVPEVCLPPPPSASARRRERGYWASAMTALAIAATMQPMLTYADIIRTTYLAPKVEVPTAAQMTNNGTTTAIYGTETFSTRPLAAAGSGTPFTTDFGTSSAIFGTVTGSFGILAADQYGGAGNTGRYLATFSPAGLSIKFLHSLAVPGINFFGIDISAVDANNVLTVYREGVLLESFTATTLQKALGACPNGSNAYCGNPTTNANAGEQYAYLSIFDLSGYFDEIRMSEASGGGFEADNFTVGYRAVNAVFGTPISVPAPASVLLLASGIVALTMLRRRREGAADEGALAAI